MLRRPKSTYNELSMCADNFETRAERRRASSRHSAWLKPAAGVLALALLGGGAYAAIQSNNDGEADSAPKPSAAACESSQTTVAISNSLAPSLKAALASYSAPKDAKGCSASYKVITVENDAYIKQMKEGSGSAFLWLTDSTLAAAQASKIVGHNLPSKTVAATPAVIAGSDEQIKSAGGDKATWEKLLTAKPPVRVADPKKDPASAFAATEIAQQLGSTQAGREKLGQWIATVGGTAANTPSARAMLLMTEQSLMKANAEGKAQGQKARSQMAFPDGSPLVNLNLINLSSGDPQMDAAYKKLSEHLTSATGTKAFGSNGWRSADGKSVPAGAPKGANSLKTVKAPSTKDMTDVMTMMDNAAKPLRMTTVIDISGSMSESVDGLSRIEAVKQAALAGLAQMPDTTSLAVWEFSTKLDGNTDYRIVEPMGSVKDTEHVNNLKKVANDLPNRLTGDTGLYDTIWAAYQAAQKDYKPGQISTVAIMTDGANDDTTGGLSLEELTKKLKAAKDPKRPVDISPVAIGDSTDLKALEGIAKLTGGKVYQAPKPQDIGAVFARSLFDRA